MKKRGFTLIELIAVIAILALLVVITLPNVMNLYNSAKKDKFASELRELYKASQDEYVWDAKLGLREKIFARSSTTCDNSLKTNGREDLQYFIRFDGNGNIVEFVATDGAYQFAYVGTNLQRDQIQEVQEVSKARKKVRITCSLVETVDNTSIVNPGTPEVEYLMNQPDGSEVSYFLSTKIRKNQIVSISFLNPHNETSVNELKQIFGENYPEGLLEKYYVNNTNCWDVGKNKTETVVAVIANLNIPGNENVYSIYILSENTIKVENTKNLFSNMPYLQLITGLNYLDTSEVTDMSYMFANSSRLFNVNLTGLNTSNVTNMSHMFSGCRNLGPIDLRGLNTSKVTDMSYMFANSRPQGINLTGLDLSKVTNMSHMFENIGSYGSITSGNLNTSSVTDMSYMFAGANIGEGDLSHFNTSNVTDMSFMFYNAGLANVDFSGLNTSKVTDMSYMFALSFELQSITGLNTSKVTTMEGMFYNAEFDGVDFSTLNTSNVENMTKMFSGSKGLGNLNITGWNTSKVTSINNMFANAKDFYSINMSGLNLSKVEDMSYLFYGCNSLESINLSNINSSSLTNMSSMFYYCKNVSEINLTNFNTSKVTDMSYLFYDCNNLENINLDFDTSKVTTMEYMFYGTGGDWLDLTHFNTASVTDMSSMFSNSSFSTIDLSSLNTSNVIDMGSMFYSCINTYSINLSGLNTSKVTNMSYMFYDCENLETINLLGFNTASVTTMNAMFYNCNSLQTLDLSSFDTSNVTNMSSMFSCCTSLTTLDLSNFNTSKVTTMNSMFNYCSSLQTLNLSNFDTSNVTNMSYMFYRCSNLTSLDLSNFNTSKVTTMESMFRECNNITSINMANWNTSKVTTMDSMFNRCYRLASLDINHFNTSKLTSMSFMFQNCSALTSLDLSNWETPKLYYASYVFSEAYNLTSIDIGNLDMSGVQYSYNIFKSVSNLVTLKTPRKSPNISFALPKVMIDNDGNAYKYLSSTTPTSTLLTKGYMVIFDAMGGTPSKESKGLKLDATTYGTLATATKPFNIFGGWYNDPNYTTEVTSSSAFSGTSDVTLYAKWTPTDFHVNYNANGGSFGGNNTNVLTYNLRSSGTPVQVKKRSYTANLSEYGSYNDSYIDNATNTYIRGTGRSGQSGAAHVLTFNGATSLHVKITYQTESTSCDWMCMWVGNYPGYNASGNCGSSFTGKLGGSSRRTVEYDVSGNTVTFSFRSDSSVHDYYGYYAEVTGLETPMKGQIISGTYSEPTRTNYTFAGWYNEPECRTEFVLDADNLTSDVTAYAKWQ